MSRFSAAGAIRIVGHTCQSTEILERVSYEGDDTLRHELQAGCRRPVWGDGVIDGKEYHLCSRCWHRAMMFDTRYLLFRPNPASKLYDPRDTTQAQALNIGTMQMPEPSDEDITWE